MYRGENVDHWSLKCLAAYDRISSRLSVWTVVVEEVVEVDEGFGRCCEYV